jgi:pyridoxamine 5'-phosphate oxidase family protein
MSVFTEEEVAYLKSQYLMRFATASPSGKPDVAPVIFRVDNDTIVTSGLNVRGSVRFKNIQKNPRATVVIDDLASVKPWTPRGIKILGSVTIEAGEGSAHLRIHPEVIVSWGINSPAPGIPKFERRAVA